MEHTPTSATYGLITNDPQNKHLSFTVPLGETGPTVEEWDDAFNALVFELNENRTGHVWHVTRSTTAASPDETLWTAPTP